jgi:peptidoglycan hydrolase-like protein with peptidoglycan-binding domain
LQSPRLQGSDVREVQERLWELGYREVGEIDGIFGLQTDAAMRHFQAANRLEVDGIIGPLTYQLLRSGDAIPLLDPAPYPGSELSADSPSHICDEHLPQEQLARLGYIEPGSEEWSSNTYGLLTAEAVRQFQATNLLP